MQIELSPEEYERMLALVELGEYALHLPVGLAVLLPKSVQRIMQQLQNLETAPEDLDESQIEEVFNAVLKGDNGEEMRGMMLEMPEIRPVLTPRDIAVYLRLYRRATLVLSGVRSTTSAEDIEEGEFNRAVDRNMVSLGTTLRQYVVLADTGPVLSDDAAQDITGVLTRRFEQGQAIKKLLEET